MASMEKSNIESLAEEAASDPIHVCLLFIYVASLSVLYLYSVSRFLNMARAIVGTRCFTDVPLQRGGKILQGEEPVVTVQICTYNEGSVVEETIKAACSIDWPKDKLVIQVNDDSTDKSSIAIIKKCCDHWSQFANITHQRRVDRVGYKAGSLKYHFASIRGEYVAHFDADHQMPRDYLRRLMPHFFDKNGYSKENIGLVQAPWAYYNVHQNALTEADALAMDVHHTLEQTGRSEFLKVFSFNGTGGIWRKSAIKDAGGWSSDTVTEDLALSYHSYMKGYDFFYVRDVPCQLELPGSMCAHIQQKHRWTKGFSQVFRLYFPDILRCPKTSFAVKWEAFTHMSTNIQFACQFMLTAFYPMLNLHGIDSDLIRLLSVLPHGVPVLESILASMVKVTDADGHYNSFWSRITRIFYILPHTALKNGMMLFETRAVFEGLFSDDATFLTTPKEGQCNKNKAKAKLISSNKVVQNSTNEFIALFGIAFASYRCAYVYFVDWAHPVTGFFQMWFHLMNLCVCYGLFWVHAGYMLDKHRAYAKRATRLCMPRQQQQQQRSTPHHKTAKGLLKGSLSLSPKAEFLV